MDPTATPQPRPEVAYETAGNAATSNPSEQKASQRHSHGDPVAQRLPPTQSERQEEGTASSLGRGIRGAPAGEESRGGTEQSTDRHRELDGEQMRAPGEGKVASAVEEKAGGGGAQPDLAAGLDRKKAEQAGAREKVKDDRARGLVTDHDARADVKV